MNQNRTYYPIRPAHRIASGYRTSVSARTWRSGDLRSYQALAPGGDVLSFVITATYPIAQSPSDHCSLITYHYSLSNLVSTTLHSPFFILNWSHTFSAKERDTETGLSYFGARYYSSDLSIWLSVDPMSGKYPSFSPYVYCANNPVKLVDPDGRQWESKADEEKALSLIEQAQDNQKTIYASIKMITSKKELSSRDKAMLNDLISQYQYLSEGIANLNDMGSSTEETFHFSNLPSIDEGCVHKRQDGVIDIIHSSDAMAWHECVHFGDYKKNLNWNFDKNGYLATAPDNYAASEYKAYESQFSFDNTSLKYSNGTTVQSISQVKIWVKFHGYDVK